MLLFKVGENLFYIAWVRAPNLECRIPKNESAKFLGDLQNNQFGKVRFYHVEYYIKIRNFNGWIDPMFVQYFYVLLNSNIGCNDKKN